MSLVSETQVVERLESGRMVESRDHMSEKYLASQWCHQELDWFAATIDRQRKNTAPIVVEVGPTERSKWPKPLQDVPGFSLYDKDCREARDPCFAYPNPEVTRSEEAARKAWLSRAA